MIDFLLAAAARKVCNFPSRFPTRKKSCDFFFIGYSIVVVCWRFSYEPLDHSTTQNNCADNEASSSKSSATSSRLITGWDVVRRFGAVALGFVFLAGLPVTVIAMVICKFAHDNFRAPIDCVIFLWQGNMKERFYLRTLNLCVQRNCKDKGFKAWVDVTLESNSDVMKTLRTFDEHNLTIFHSIAEECSDDPEIAIAVARLLKELDLEIAIKVLSSVPEVGRRGSISVLHFLLVGCKRDPNPLCELLKKLTLRCAHHEFVAMLKRRDWYGKTFLQHAVLLYGDATSRIVSAIGVSATEASQMLETITA